MTLYDRTTLAIFTVIQNLIFFRYELFVVYTHARMENSPAYYFLPILSKMFSSFFHYFFLAGRLDAVFFLYRFTFWDFILRSETRLSEVFYILPPHFSIPFSSTVFPSSTQVLGLYLNRGWMLFVTLQNIFTLFFLFFAPSSVFVHFCKSWLMMVPLK